MAATASIAPIDECEPLRVDCPGCDRPVLVVVVPAVPKLKRLERTVIADPYEWEPRTRCYVCANNAARSGQRCPDCSGTGHRGTSRFMTRQSTSLGVEYDPCKRCDGLGSIGAPRRADCSRCAGAGFVGEPRPTRQMLAVDIAWSDEGHIRLLGPQTPRRKGEALYELHRCR